MLADVAREATNELIDRLDALGIPECGTIHIEPVTTWVSRAGFDAERHTPGSSADAVVWADVTQRAYEETELNWTYLSFMTLATLLAGIAIVVDSQILVIGAMVLGPGVHRHRRPRTRPRATTRHAVRGSPPAPCSSASASPSPSPPSPPRRARTRLGRHRAT